MGRFAPRGPCPSLLSMLLLTQALWVSSFFLELAILWRGKKARLLSRYPLLYSYVAYTFLWSYTTFLIFWLMPVLYPSTYWAFYLLWLLAKFAVIAAISDQIFEPYPAIRYMGRFVVILVVVAFSALFILPTLIQHSPSASAILKFSLWASLAKVAIIAAVIVTAHYYRLRLSRTTTGLMTGFVLHLGVTGTSLAVGDAFGKELSAFIFRFIVPSGWVVCLLVWMVTLWNPEPVTEEAPDLQIQPDWVLSHEIDRLNEALSKRLGR